MKPNKPYIVGLTGTIGAGKSTCAAAFKKLGVPVVDADRIAYDLCAPGGAGLEAIRRAFGAAYVTDEGAYNREKMRGTIACDPAALEKLNALLHPLIGAEIEREIAACAAPVLVYDCPLLFETGEDARADTVLLVTADEATRLSRLMARDGMSEDQARARSALQMGEAEKISRADAVLCNNGSAEELEAGVKFFLDNLQKPLA